MELLDAAKVRFLKNFSRQIAADFVVTDIESEREALVLQSGIRLFHIGDGFGVFERQSHLIFAAEPLHAGERSLQTRDIFVELFFVHVIFHAADRDDGTFDQMHHERFQSFCRRGQQIPFQEN